MFRLLNGGLDLAVEQVFGAQTAWHCELEKIKQPNGTMKHNAAIDVLAAHWPGVPNHGDLTTIDWDSVEPVDIMTAGYPCQPFSAAGKRKGADDERNIWPEVREAIRRVRPRITLLENVSGHRSMGFDRVLGDLAEDGMHVRWASLRAADVGSCHARERLFIVVTPDPDERGAQHEERDLKPVGPELEAPQWGDTHGRGDDAVDLLPTPAASRSGRNKSQGPNAAIRPPMDMIADLLPTPQASDGNGGKSSPHLGGVRPSGAKRSIGLTDITHLLPTPTARDHKGGSSTVPDGHGALADADWGKYGPAIRRWENLTRPAPPPTEPNTKGNPRLAPAFPEWMMGLPAGWVTGVSGISRNDQLRIIGNGVVPQQAIAALTWLLALEQAA